MAVERETEGDLVLSDMGEGVPFRAGCFDGAVSVSAIQWLFNADKKSHQPVKRLYKFFSTLYASLVCALIMIAPCLKYSMLLIYSSSSSPLYVHYWTPRIKVWPTFPMLLENAHTPRLYRFSHYFPSI